MKQTTRSARSHGNVQLSGLSQRACSSPLPYYIHKDGFMRATIDDDGIQNILIGNGKRLSEDAVMPLRT